jgi:hypothetical protein
VLAVTAVTWLLADGYLTGGIIDTADVEDYCGGAAWLTAEDAPWPRRRSRLAGLLPGLLTPLLGALDALAVGALVGCGMLVAGLLLWAGSLGGASAGVSAAVLVAGLAPLAVLSRHLSFYPLIAGGLTLCAGLVAWGSRRTDRWGMVAVSAGIFLAPLWDLRGIVWCLALTGLAVLLAMRAEGRRLRMAAIVVALVLSWGAGRLAYPADAVTLEEQAWQAVHLDALAASQAQGQHGIPAQPTRTIWGRTNPLTLPSGLLTVARIADQAPLRSPEFALDDRQLRAWSLPLLLAGLLALVGLRRDPRAILILAATSLPFLLAWIDAARFGRAELRQLSLAAPGVAVVLGVGIGVLCARLTGPWRWLPVGLLALLLLPGLPLSPGAGWRTPTPSRQFLLGPILIMARRGEQPPARLRAACIDAISDGHSRIYGDLLLAPTR